MARAYLGAFWNRRYCRGDAGSVIGTLRDGSVVVIVDGSTLVYGAVVGIGDGTTLGDRSLVNAFIVILAHGPCNHCLYSCDIPVMISITVLASN